MARTSDRVMDMVRREVQKNPDVKSGELYEQAKKLDRSISSLSLRQFHAQYPLQVKRAMKSGGTRRTRKKAAKRGSPAGTGRKTAGRKRTTARKKTTRKRAAAKKRPGRPRKKATRTRRTGAGRGGRRTTTRAASGGGERGTVRAVLLEFAGEVANAENKADLISVVSGMDRWVDRLMNAAS